MSRGLWLSAEQVAEVRHYLAMGKLKSVIARRTGIDSTAVSRIANGKRKSDGVCLCAECRVCKNRLTAKRYRKRKSRRVMQGRRAA